MRMFTDHPWSGFDFENGLKTFNKHKQCTLPEHEGGVDPGLGGVHVVRPILAFAHLHLHELGKL